MATALVAVQQVAPTLLQELVVAPTHLRGVALVAVTRLLAVAQAVVTQVVHAAVATQVAHAAVATRAVAVAAAVAEVTEVVVNHTHEV